MSVPLKRKYNTRVYKEGLVTTVWLYDTPIVEFNAETRMATLFTGGWETVTTRRRMNEALEELCGTDRVSIYARKGRTVARLNGIEHPFVGGLLTLNLF